ncbi:hypothetical protein [Streptomyces niphimycinicus]|uniref:hypothetical protein n=1 Tax=Streptomyces niphimycinicus TaxID=2842201 RepID=UPI001C0D55CF|nr:hypothetical protein [Streptomyces niphimycinicus]
MGDGLYDTKDEAEQAGRKAVQMGRAHLVTLLPADLAATAESWPEPEVTTWN